MAIRAIITGALALLAVQPALATPLVSRQSYPTAPLQEFHTQFFNGIFVSTNDTLFNETFDNGYSQDLVDK